MEFRTFYTFELLPSDLEHNDLPSETIPDQSLTIRQLFERYACGTLDCNVREDVFYDDNVDFDRVDPTEDPMFDLADFTELQLELELERRKCQSDRESVLNRPGEASNEADSGDEVSSSPGAD